MEKSMDRERWACAGTVFPDFESLLGFFADKTAEYTDKENGNGVRLYKTEKGLEIARSDGYKALVTGIDKKGRLSVKHEMLLYKGLDGRMAYKSVHGVLWGITVADIVIQNGRIEKIGLSGPGIAPDKTPPIRYLTVKRSKCGCYIATCVYGSYDCPQVWLLRRFRDRILKRSRWGRAFIRLYYTVSPMLVEVFGHRGWFRGFFRLLLDGLTVHLKRKGFEDSPYHGC